MIMKITIDYTKSAQENADYFYKRSKKLAQKKAGAEASIINLEKRLKAAKVVTESTQKKRIKITEKEMVPEIPLVLHERRPARHSGKGCAAERAAELKAL